MSRDLSLIDHNSIEQAIIRDTKNDLLTDFVLRVKAQVELWNGHIRNRFDSRHSLRYIVWSSLKASDRLLFAVDFGLKPIVEAANVVDSGMYPLEFTSTWGSRLEFMEVLNRTEFQEKYVTFPNESYVWVLRPRTPVNVTPEPPTEHQKLMSFFFGSNWTPSTGVRP